MVTKQRVSPYDVARRLTEELRSDRTLISLWMRNTNDGVDFWLYTEPMTTEQELRLYDLEMLLFREFPDINPQIHVIHKGLYDESSHFVFVAPPGAEQITVPR